VAVSRALRRLLRIREIEEEQCRLALEVATGDLNRLNTALAATGERERAGRRLVGTSARTGELTDRLAGLEEARSAERMAAALVPHIADAETDVALLRQEFLAKRVECRQAETLIEESRLLDAREQDRRSQDALDDWFRNRQFRERSNAATAEADTVRGFKN
jgi:hypothetical protein